MAATPVQLRDFRHSGFLVLRGAVEPAVAERFYDERILPGLRSAGYEPDDPSTWHTGEKWHAVWDHDKANNNRLGCMVSCLGDDTCPSLFESERLVGAIDQLHGGAGRWSFHGGGHLGSVHLRYPADRKRAGASPTPTAAKAAAKAAAQWSPPRLGWHVDGAHFHHHIQSREQSLVVLPVFRQLEAGGGGTVLLPGSHRTVARWLAGREHGKGGAGGGGAGAGADGANHGGAAYMQLFWRAHRVANACGSRARMREAAPCEAGDVLLMSPFLVHSASANRRLEWRVAFNLGCSWEQDLDLGAACQGLRARAQAQGGKAVTAPPAGAAVGESAVGESAVGESAAGVALGVGPGGAGADPNADGAADSQHCGGGGVAAVKAGGTAGGQGGGGGAAAACIQVPALALSPLELMAAEAYLPFCPPAVRRVVTAPR
jgi:hypothetical protein